MSFGPGTISSEVKMAIGRNFIEIWKKHFSLISTSVYSLVLVVLEKILECEFKCPEELHLRCPYAILHFIMPAVTFFILGIIFQAARLHPSQRENEFYYSYNKCGKGNSDSTDKHEFSSCWCIFLKASFPAVLWIVILLLDGRYVDCLSENITGYQISQISGLVIMALVVNIGLVCKFCYKKGYRQKITVDEAEIKNLLEQRAREYILKQKEEAIWQRINDECLADPENFLESINEETVSGIIARVCNISREGSGDKGGMASTSPPVTSSQLPRETSRLLPEGTSSPPSEEIPENSSCPRV
ncbi:uncharacterized protein LOC120380202 [Mauremys reevesii]|uniref:uncharacterized protein LOC120380202 n=1 Tax=Mauremys reevesii TaxID=260615 RepID=UPI00193EF98A|nr:uncharacterized protein LOC120380202 [Mauremys reevesii]